MPYAYRFIGQTQSFVVACFQQSKFVCGRKHLLLLLLLAVSRCVGLILLVILQLYQL